MAKLTYKAFADNDYMRFMDQYERGELFWGMAADAQEICEKYLKHLISVLYVPENDLDYYATTEALHKHGLQALVAFLRDRVGLRFEPTEEALILVANGYYYTSRCPGEEAAIPTRLDLERCATAIQTCHDLVGRIENEITESRSEDAPGDGERYH